MKREKTLIRNTLILTIGNIFPKISTFLLLPILTAALTKFEFGVYDLVLTSTSFIFPIATLLIEQAVFRFLLDANNEEERKNNITNTAVFIFAISILLAILSFILLKQLNIISYGLITLYIIVNLYNRFVLQVTRGLGKLKYYSFSSIINSILSFVMILLALQVFEFGLQGLLFSINLSMFVATIYIAYKIKLFSYINMSYFSGSDLKRLLQYSAPLIPNSISWWIVSASDRWIISIFLGVESNALYAVANKIPSIVNLIYSNFNLAWQESATISSNDNDADNYYTIVFKYLFDFLTGTIVMLISLSPYIFKIFVDSSYSQAYYQIPILFLAMFFHSFSSFYGGVYIALKKSKELSTSSLIAAFLNILINILFISLLGLYAASISTLISYFLLTIHRAFYIKNDVIISYNFKEIILKLSLVLIVSIFSYSNNALVTIVNVLFGLFVSVILNKILLKNLFIKIKDKMIG